MPVIFGIKIGRQKEPQRQELWLGVRGHYHTTLEPDAEGNYGRDAEVVGLCSRCTFTTRWPNYLWHAEIFVHESMEKHFQEAHYLEDRYDRLVGEA